MKRYVFFIFVGILIQQPNSSLYGQWKVVDASADTKPSWINETPIGNSYTYYSGLGSSTTSLQQAQENAVGGVLQRLVEEGTFNVSIESTTETSETRHSGAGELQFEVTDDFIREVVLSGTSKTLTGLQKEEDYWQSTKSGTGIKYQYWVLFKLPKPGVYPNTFKPAGYGFAPVWRSILLPGWGQIHKKEVKKGKRLLAGFVTTLTTGVATQHLSNNYAIDAENANDGEWIDYYNTLSEQYYLTSTIAYILSGAIYGYNVYDSVASKGAKIYAHSGNSDINVFLAQAFDGTPQISITLNI
jgi:hypothetical protein